MDEKTLNYFNYFTEIEDHFIRRRGKHILLSPLDWTLIGTWREMGVSLHVALRGIDRAMDLFTARQTRHRFVNSLFYCHQAVMEEHEAHLLSLEGAAPGGGEGAAAEPKPAADRAAGGPRAAVPGADVLRRFLERRREELGALASRHPGTAVQEAAERVLARLEALAGVLDEGARIDPERLESDLAAMDEVLVPVLEAALGREQLAGVTAECREELRHHRRSLDKTVYERILRNFVRKKIKDHFGVSDLSLLDMPWN